MGKYNNCIFQLLTFSSRIVIFFSDYFCTNNSVKAGNDVIIILIGEDMEKFHVNFTSGVFSTKTLLFIL